jgi:choline dehydrogenase-like flavoprotein
MPVIESDICIIGGGITAAMLAERLLELRPGASINVVEAGKRLFDLEQRMEYRKRKCMAGRFYRRSKSSWRHFPDYGCRGFSAALGRDLQPVF